MKKTLKKVSLSKETILRLTRIEMSRIHGGNGTDGWSEQSICPTTTPSDCKPCG